ncbi:hypothetical protein BN439_1055 [Erwinia amylovora Ea644]|nr:hypothetical protein BN439_1055 [Erwinia amylovora Ea644]
MVEIVFFFSPRSYENLLYFYYIFIIFLLFFLITEIVVSIDH